MKAASTAPPRELILDAAQIGQCPWEPFGETDDVHYRTLWLEPQSRSYAGVMRMDPGAAVAPHAHRYAVHHVWVTQGACLIGGRRLERGSYAFVPAGVKHGIQPSGAGGCMLFYLFLRTVPD